MNICLPKRKKVVGKCLEEIFMFSKTEHLIQKNVQNNQHCLKFKKLLFLYTNIFFENKSSFLAIKNVDLDSRKRSSIVHLFSPL